MWQTSHFLTTAKQHSPEGPCGLDRGLKAQLLRISCEWRTHATSTPLLGGQSLLVLSGRVVESRRKEARIRSARQGREVAGRRRENRKQKAERLTFEVPPPPPSDVCRPWPIRGDIVAIIGHWDCLPMSSLQASVERGQARHAGRVLMSRRRTNRAAVARHGPRSAGRA